MVTLVVVLAAVAGAVESPASTLSGRVLSRGTREPVAHAAVQAGDVVVQTNSEGAFTLVIAPGVIEVQVLAGGFSNATFTEQLGDGETVEVLYRLTPDRVNPYETTVRAERDRVETTRFGLNAQELRETAGTMGDPFRAVMTMPGIGTLGSGLSYPVVRGSQPGATGAYLDGIRLPMMFHLLVGPAVVHPDLLGALDFHAGAAPAEFGRLVGGAIEGHTAKPRTDRVHATVTLDLLNVGGLIEVPFESTDTHVTLAGRYAWPGLLAGVAANAIIESDGSLPPWAFDFWDAQLRIDQKVGDGSLRLFALTTTDFVQLSDANPHEFSGTLSSGFSRIDLRLQHPVWGGKGEVGVTFGTEGIGVTVDQAGSQIGELSFGQYSLAARARWQRVLGKTLTLLVATDVEGRSAHSVVSGSAAPVGRRGATVADALRQPETLGVLGGLVGQLTWKPDSKWGVTGGLRADVYHLRPDVLLATLEPRIAVERRLNDAVTLEAGAGWFHQAPTVLLPLPALDFPALRQGLQSALQFDIGARWQLPVGLEVSADLYANPYLRAVEITARELVENRTRASVAERDPGVPGVAYGAELLVRYPLGRQWFGWASYAYQQSLRQTTFHRFGPAGELLGEDTAWLPFAFEQRHVVNAAVSYKFLNNWSLGLTFHLNTGRPESGQIASVTRREAVDAQGEPTWVRVDADALGRLPTFFRFDLRVAKSWAMDTFTLDAYLDIFNVSISQEVLGFNYGHGYDDEGNNVGYERRPFALPIVLPVLGLKGTY